MGSHSMAPDKVRLGRTLRGGLALFLVAGALVAISVVGSGIAGAAALTGFFAPRVADGRVDINNDGLVNDTDDSTGFFAATALIDGRLDCNAWGVTVNAGSAGSGTITSADDCVLEGFAIGTGTNSSPILIYVVDGYFAFTADPTLLSKSVIATGYRLPGVFDIAASFNFGAADMTAALSVVDWSWHLVSGKVDRDSSNTITTEGYDDQANFLPGGGDGADVKNGFVDLDGDGTTGEATDDSCTTECFFGQNVASGLVGNNTPTNRYTGTTGAQGPAGTNGVSGRTTVTASSLGTSENKGVTATCPTGTKVIGGGFRLSSATASNLKALTVVKNLPTAADAWTARAIEATPISGAWTITVTAVCATA